MATVRTNYYTTDNFLHIVGVHISRNHELRQGCNQSRLVYSSTISLRQYWPGLCSSSNKTTFTYKANRMKTHRRRVFLGKNIWTIQSYMYTVFKKQDTWFLIITSAVVDRFSKCFLWQIFEGTLFVPILFLYFTLLPDLYLYSNQICSKIKLCKKWLHTISSEIWKSKKIWKSVHITPSYYQKSSVFCFQTQSAIKNLQCIVMISLLI